MVFCIAWRLTARASAIWGTVRGPARSNVLEEPRSTAVQSKSA